MVRVFLVGLFFLSFSVGATPGVIDLLTGEADALSLSPGQSALVWVPGGEQFLTHTLIALSSEKPVREVDFIDVETDQAIKFNPLKNSGTDLLIVPVYKSLRRFKLRNRSEQSIRVNQLWGFSPPFELRPANISYSWSCEVTMDGKNPATIEVPKDLVGQRGQLLVELPNPNEPIQIKVGTGKLAIYETGPTRVRRRHLVPLSSIPASVPVRILSESKTPLVARFIFWAIQPPVTVAKDNIVGKEARMLAADLEAATIALQKRLTHDFKDTDLNLVLEINLHQIRLARIVFEREPDFSYQTIFTAVALKTHLFETKKRIEALVTVAPLKNDSLRLLEFYQVLEERLEPKKK